MADRVTGDEYESKKWQGGNGQSRSARNLWRKDLEFELMNWFEMLCVAGHQCKAALYRCSGNHGIPSPQTVSQCILLNIN